MHFYILLCSVSLFILSYFVGQMSENKKHGYVNYIIAADCHLSFCRAIHGMQMWYSDENSVRLSVSPSNVWIVTKDKKNLCRFVYHTKYHLAQFYQKKKWLVWGDPFHLKFWGQSAPVVVK